MLARCSPGGVYAHDAMMLPMLHVSSSYVMSPLLSMSAELFGVDRAVVTESEHCAPRRSAKSPRGSSLGDIISRRNARN